MADIIQIRRDLAANWTSVNPALAQGEMGYELDTGKLKFGDASTVWNSLPYFTGDTSTLDLQAVTDNGSTTTNSVTISGNLILTVDSYKSENGILYQYDTTRTKWLSTETSALQWANNGATDGQMLQFGGNMANFNSGPRMPFDGTIVRITAQSSGGLATKGFAVGINGASSFTFNLSSNVYTDTTRNVNFSAGDYLGVYCLPAGVAVDDPAVTIWVKWRV